tara:strand:+ start:1914 stop:2273 length:360 start_codon:yes stop_codon:yes gene_type:complete
MRYVILFLLILSGFAEADSFEDRIASAKVVLDTPEGAKYRKSTDEMLYAEVPECFSKPGPTKGWFTLVATISSLGVATDIKAQPESTLSNCIASFLKSAALPEPPSDMYPILFEVNIVP